MKALREAITNAVMHRDWFIEGANVFVEIYTDRIEVVSPGSLPKGMTLADLGSKSVRRNALIADLLHRIDFIEKAGTGIRRIREEAQAGGYPEPGFEANGFVTAIFRPNPGVRAMATAQSTRGVGTKLALSRHQFLNLLLERGLLEMTIPDKPRSSKQRYRLTRVGLEYLQKIEETM